MIYVSTTFAVDNTPVSKVLNQCALYGLNYIELWSNHCWENDVLEKIYSYKFNYLVHNYFPVPKKSLIVNIASQNKNIWRSSLNHIYKSIDFCNKIGAGLYTFHPGFLLDPISNNQNSKNYDFIFCDDELTDTNYNKCFENMIKAIDLIIPYSQKKNVKIAIETEGSSKKTYCFMYTHDEYEKFIKYYSKYDIGINLNLGHLNLASKAFNFKKEDFVNLIQDYIVAMELSHNDGIEDQHLPLEVNAWYWRFIEDVRFKNAYKILEFRNKDIPCILDVMKML